MKTPLTTWVPGAAGSQFDVDNLPYGVFSRVGEEPRVGVRIGDLVLDLAPVAAAEMLDVHHVFEERTLNALMAEGRAVRESVRRWVRQADIDDGVVDGKTTSEQNELVQLRREKRRLEQENEILRRAAAYFAAGSLPK